MVARGHPGNLRPAGSRIPGRYPGFGGSRQWQSLFVTVFNPMESLSSLRIGESRFTNPTSELHRNLDRFLGGIQINGASQLAAISQNWTITPRDPATYSSVVRSWQHGKLMLTHCAGDAVTFHRTVSHLGDAYDRYIQIGVLKTGNIVTTQRGDKLSLGPNSIVTLLLAEEFISTTSDGMDIVLLYLPRSYLESRGVNTESMAGAMQTDAAVCEPLRALVEWAFVLQQLNDHTQRGFVERALLELLTGIGTKFADGFVLMDALSVSIRSQALNIIDSSYSDPTTSVDTIAKALGFSRRQMYRIFQGREVSLARMIKERRIDRAEHLLKLVPRKSIASIAEECGFAGPDQFSRAFRERHGYSPLKYKARMAHLSNGLSTTSKPQ